MSTTSATDPTHIAESIEQILCTSFLERPMEGNSFYSNVALSLFEPNDMSLQQVLKSRIVEALARLEKRIECDESGVEFVVEIDDDGVSTLYVNITYRIIKYNTTYTSKVKVGELGE